MIGAALILLVLIMFAAGTSFHFLGQHPPVAIADPTDDLFALAAAVQDPPREGLANELRALVADELAARRKHRPGGAR